MSGPIEYQPLGNMETAGPSLLARLTAGRGKKWLRRAAIGLLLFLGFGAVVGFISSVDTESPGLQVGDCTGFPAVNTDYFEAEELPCTERHALEVYGLVDVDPDRGEEYPGHDMAWALTESLCRPFFRDYTGEPLRTSAYGLYTVYPGRGAWDEGYTEGTCLLAIFGENDQLLERSGSARDGGE